MTEMIQSIDLTGDCQHWKAERVRRRISFKKLICETFCPYSRHGSFSFARRFLFFRNFTVPQLLFISKFPLLWAAVDSIFDHNETISSTVHHSSAK
jgi:hypothetical protein